MSYISYKKDKFLDTQGTGLLLFAWFMTFGGLTLVKGSQKRGSRPSALRTVPNYRRSNSRIRLVVRSGDDTLGHTLLAYINSHKSNLPTSEPHLSYIVTFWVHVPCT